MYLRAWLEKSHALIIKLLKAKTNFTDCSGCASTLTSIASKDEYISELKAKTEESVFSQKFVNDDYVPIQISPIETFEKIIEHRRNSLYDDLCVGLQICDFPTLRSSQIPVFLEENYYLDDTFEAPNSEELCEGSQRVLNRLLSSKIHLFVLVHGLGGTFNDMLNFKNYIMLVNPNAEFIIPK